MLDGKVTPLVGQHHTETEMGGLWSPGDGLFHTVCFALDYQNGVGHAISSTGSTGETTFNSVQLNDSQLSHYFFEGYSNNHHRATITHALFFDRFLSMEELKHVLDRVETNPTIPNPLS
jgi:hypothetical protein